MNNLNFFEGFDTSSGSCLVAHADFDNKLSHERFGHFNYRYLKELSTHDMVIGLPKVSYLNGVCPGCALGKLHQDTFPKCRTHKASSPLELVRSDLMVFPTSSFKGAKYALTFIIDFSRHT